MGTVTQTASKVASSAQGVHTWRVQEAEERARLFTRDGLEQAGGRGRQTGAAGWVFSNQSRVTSPEQGDLEVNTGLWVHSARCTMPTGRWTAAPQRAAQLEGLAAQAGIYLPEMLCV